MKKLLPVLMVWVSPALAAAPVDPLVQAFDQCFTGSTQRQFLNNLGADPNMVAEVAFQACATEEDAIYTFLTLQGMQPGNARASILTRKLRLKRQIVVP